MKTKINTLFMFRLICALFMTASIANAAPTLTFTAPTSPVVNKTNQAFLRVAGTCSEIGEQVKVNVAGKVISAQAVCQDGGLWSIENFSVVTLPDGAFSFSANYLSGSATPVTMAMTKDTSSPLLTMTSPLNGSSISVENFKAVKFVGRCGELNRDVVVTLKSALNSFPQQVTEKVLCPSSRIYAITVDTSTLPDLSDIQAMVTHADPAGNVSRQDIVLFKDAEPINVTLTGLPAAVNITNAASLKLGGTCNKPSNPIFFDVLTENGDLAQTLETICSEAGQWEIPNISITEIPDGRITFTVTHFSLNTNDDSSKSVTLIKDVVPPVLSVTNPVSGFKMNSVNGTILAVAGTCTEEGVNVDLGTPAKVASSACKDGKFLISYNFSPSRDGDILVRVSQSDAAGNTAVQSLSFQKDVLPPSLTFTNPTSLNITANNAANMVFGGSCSEHGAYAQSVSLAFSGATSQCEGGSCVAQCVGGVWSMMASVTTAADGDFVVTARHQDSAGNVAQSVRTFKKDTVPPSLAITTPAIVEGSKYRLNASNVKSVTFAGTCTENGAVITLSDSTTGSVVCQNLSWSIIKDLSGVADGDRNIRFTIADDVGNSKQQDLVLFKDTILPKLAILVPAADPFNINAEGAANIIFSGTCSEKAAYAQPVLLTGAIEATAACQDTGKWSIMFSRATIPDGAGEITVSHSDMAGNTVSIVKKFIKDSEPPTLTITSPVAGFRINSANVTSVRFGGACSEVGRAIALSGATTASTKCTNGKTWAVNVNMTSAPDGDLLIKATHTDAALNLVRQDVGLYKKTTLPTLTWDQPTSDLITEQNAAALMLKGTCSENGRQVNVSGGNVNAMALCNRGQWTLTVSLYGNLAGKLDLKASHSDLAGNSVVVNRTFENMATPPGCDIQLANVEDFKKLNPVITGKKLCLANDIVLTEGEQMPSMQLIDSEFNGRGFKIKGFVVRGSGGLFATVLRSKVSNLILESVTFEIISSSNLYGQNMGILANWVMGGSVIENVRIQDITLAKFESKGLVASSCGLLIGGVQAYAPAGTELKMNTIRGVSVEFKELNGFICADTGGLVGSASSTIFKDILVKGNLLEFGSHSSVSGGIVGSINDSHSSFRNQGQQVQNRVEFDNSHFIGSVVAKNPIYLGGLIGAIYNSRNIGTNLKITDSSFAGNLSSSGSTISTVGGAIGYITGSDVANDLTFKNLSIRGNISASPMYLGGIFGYAFNADTTIDSSEVVVNVVSSKASNIGGIIGYTSNYQSQAGSKYYSSFSLTNSIVDFSIVLNNKYTLAGLGGVAGGAFNLLPEKLHQTGNTISMTLTGNTHCMGGLYCDSSYIAFPADQQPATAGKRKVLVYSGTPTPTVKPKLNGSITTVTKNDDGLLVVGTAYESNVTKNIATVRISIGTSAAARRVLGFTNSKTPDQNSFNFIIPQSILYNCKEAWANNCSKIKIYAEAIDREGNVLILPGSGKYSLVP